MPKNDLKNPILSHNILEFEDLVYSIRNNWGCMKVMFKEFSVLSSQKELSPAEYDISQALSAGIYVIIDNFADVFNNFLTLHSCFNSCSCFKADCVHCHNFDKCKDLDCLHLSDMSVAKAPQRNSD